MTDDVWPTELRGQHPVNPDTEDMFLEMMRPPDRLPHPETEAAELPGLTIGELNIRSACPSCGTVAMRTTYDIGSGPELACATCEWCWGANGQPLEPLRFEGPGLNEFRLRTT